MTVAQADGMIQPGASDMEARRATSPIDREDVPRVTIYSPMDAGRSVDEIYRLLVAMQTADEHACAMQGNWTPQQARECPLVCDT
jgi:peroxiredoxin (alkyl hydroperoxide reductase subunit C)